jgi:single-strand DNA-binding protein
MSTNLKAKPQVKNEVKSELKNSITSKKALKAAAVELDSELALNDVLLRGRVSSIAQEKELPSGDKVSEFRIVIARNSEEGFDTIDISAWSSKVRRIAGSLKIDQWVEVSGSIKRRFWRGATGLASRWQIDASEITRL